MTFQPTDQSVTNSQWNAAEEANATERARRAPHVLMQPRVFRDGNQWCALRGENMMVGVVGFGDSPAKACEAFDAVWAPEATK